MSGAVQRQGESKGGSVSGGGGGSSGEGVSGCGASAAGGVKQRCTYDDCEKPDESTRYFTIGEEELSARDRDWSSLRGNVLCMACYKRFKNKGTLKRSAATVARRSRNLRTQSGNPKRCTYKGCEKPEESCQFYQIHGDQKAGGKDWSKLQGEVLCSEASRAPKSKIPRKPSKFADSTGTRPFACPLSQ